MQAKHEINRLREESGSLKAAWAEAQIDLELCKSESTVLRAALEEIRRTEDDVRCVLADSDAIVTEKNRRLEAYAAECRGAHKAAKVRQCLSPRTLLPVCLDAVVALMTDTCKRASSCAGR